jgi:hypothetical protein
MEVPMDVERIREVVRRRPFKPIVFHLENGEKHFVKHPEIVVGIEFIMTVDETGHSVLITPEAVSSIEFIETDILMPEQTAGEP